MKFGIILFPGSNCDRDMAIALREELDQEVVMLWHKDRDISSFSTNDCLVLPGGFSYGDYLRCGAIARFSPIMQSVVRFAARGGKILGICNGFQILCESGLLPGALLRNETQRFVCRNIYISSSGEQNGEPLKIPVAHGEGRYHADEKTLESMLLNKQIRYRDCDREGRINSEANPNGALLNIAGISNREGNVTGMMPHPERACNKIFLGNDDGKKIFHQLYGLN